jgi:hypothetical protein
VLCVLGGPAHPQPAPAPDGATITLTVPLNTAVVDGQTFQIYTVGSWTVLPLAVSPEEPPPDPMTPPGPPKPIGPVTYPFNTSTSLSGRLDALTAQDVFLVLRYAGDALTGYAVAEPFAQSDATTVNMSTLLDLSLSQSFDLKPPVGLVNRYGGVSPAVGSPTLSWTLVAAPGHSVAEPAGPVLRRGGFNADDVVGVTVQYGNPFAQDRDWKTLLSFTTEETRPYMPMGTTAQLTLRAGMSELFEPRDGVVNELELRAGLPMRIKLNNVQLVLDGQQTSVPNEPVEVTFTTDNTNATLYNLQVSEVVVSDDKTSVSTRMILDAASIEPRFELRPELFVVGHSYVLRAICTSGSYPGLETGDLVTRSLPLWQSFLDSGVFTVTP